VVAAVESSTDFVLGQKLDAIVRVDNLTTREPAHHVRYALKNRILVFTSRTVHGAFLDVYLSRR